MATLREADLMYSGNSGATYEDLYGEGAPTEETPVQQEVDAIDETVDIDSIKSLVKQLGAALGLDVSDPAEDDLGGNETDLAEEDLGPGYQEE